MAEENTQNEQEIPEDIEAENAGEDLAPQPSGIVSGTDTGSPPAMEPDDQVEEAQLAETIPGPETVETEVALAATAVSSVPPVSSVPQTTWEPTPMPTVSTDSIPTLPVAVLLIGMGIILIWPVLSDGYILLPEIIAAILVGGLAFSLLAYWLKSGRQARGALFVALTGLAAAGITGLFVWLPQTLTLITGWPLYLAGIGLSVLLAFAADRHRSRRFFTPALVLILSGLFAFAVTSQIIPERVLDIARQGWPWVFGALILGLLPLAFRRASNRA